MGDFFLKRATFKATAHYFLLEKVGLAWLGLDLVAIWFAEALLCSAQLFVVALLHASHIVSIVTMFLVLSIVHVLVTMFLVHVLVLLRAKALRTYSLHSYCLHV